MGIGNTIRTGIMYAALGISSFLNGCCKSDIEKGRPLEVKVQTLSYDEILRNQIEEGRFELLQWDKHPEIYVLDFADYEEHKRAVHRLHCFDSRRGLGDKILTDDELKEQGFGEANSFCYKRLEDFFARSDNESIKLNESEESVRRIYKKLPKDSALVTVSFNENPIFRNMFLDHERRHGLYYVCQEYIDLVDTYWNELSNEEKRFYTELLTTGSNFYDEEDVVDETQAYYARANFPEPLKLLVLRCGSEYVKSVLEKNPDFFEQQEEVLNGKLRMFLEN